MKLVYTNENRLIVGNARNLLEAAGIEVLLKNEFAAGGAGDIPVFEAWMEVWVVHDGDYDRACELLAGALSDEASPAWRCGRCSEDNDASFDLCWQCGAEQPGAYAEG